MTTELVEQRNGFLSPIPPKENNRSMIEETRVMQEIQGAIVSAKKFPRNSFEAYERIMQACKRPSLAQKAMYSYPRGGQTVRGPSIRLAEVLLQNWGNARMGTVEISQSAGESHALAFAWDLENNVFESKVFIVKHKRKARGEVKDLDDPRDIYEMVANQGSRRKRACILAIIPADIIEDAVEQCERTIKQGLNGNLEDRIRKMILAFKEVGVDQKMLEARLEHTVDTMTPDEFVDLQTIYTSLKDKQSRRSDYFETPKKVDDDIDKKMLGK